MTFADASFFIGLVDKQDQWHKRALELLEGLKDELVVTNLVIYECVSIIGQRSGGMAGTTLYNFFNDNCHVEYVTDDVFDEAMKIFFEQNGKISVSDAITLAFMKKRKVKSIISFDPDFDRINDIDRIN